jgi:GTP pyrophosphokinase
MPKVIIPQTTIKKIDKLVNIYASEQNRFIRFTNAVHDSLSTYDELLPYVHSFKKRTKDPSHLREKLIRKALEAKKNKLPFEINETNLFDKIQDCSGVRILHLHTEQMQKIDFTLKKLFDEESYSLFEGPIANTWDDEYSKFFKDISIKVKRKDTLYTSVHYVIQSNNKFQTKCEIQVRTLMEEVWGEVSHRINYPDESLSIACQEQLRVLARVTSSGTRLVDSIFKSKEEFEKLSELKK